MSCTEIKFLKLTKGLYGVVDVDVFRWASKFKWYAQRYWNSFRIQRNSSRPNRKTIILHRQILGIEDPNIIVDHINLDGTWDTRDNLRICTRKENALNRLKFRGKYSSKFKGVSWHQRSNKYQAYITSKKIRTHLGMFTNPTKAARAYDAAARKLHGEFARLNFHE